MDMSDVGVRHSIALSDLSVRHTVDFSSSVVATAREIRFCVVAIVVGWITTRVVSELSRRKSAGP